MSVVNSLNASITYSRVTGQLNAQPYSSVPVETLLIDNTHGEVMVFTRSSGVPYAVVEAVGSSDLRTNGDSFSAALSGGVTTLAGVHNTASGWADFTLIFTLDQPADFHFTGGVTASPGDGGSDQTIAFMFLEYRRVYPTADPPLTIFTVGTGLFPGLNHVISETTPSSLTSDFELQAGYYQFTAVAWTRTHNDSFYDRQGASFSATFSTVPEPSIFPLFLICGLLGSVGYKSTTRLSQPRLPRRGSGLQCSHCGFKQ